MQQKLIKNTEYELKTLTKKLLLLNNIPQNTVNQVRKYLEEKKKSLQDRQKKSLNDKYQIQQKVNIIERVLNGQRQFLSAKLNESVVDQSEGANNFNNKNSNSIPESAKQSSNVENNQSNQSNENKINSSQYKSGVNNDNEVSEISESEKKDRSHNFTEFCQNIQNKLLDNLKVNKNILPDFDDKSNIFIVGSCQPKEKKGLILCAAMKFDAQQLIDLNRNTKDLEVFINTQRFPIAVAKFFNDNQQLDGNFLHSIANLPSELRLGIIKKPNKNFSIIKLTKKGKQFLDNCDKTDQIHFHGWKQQKTEWYEYYSEDQTSKVSIQQKQVQTKHLKRASQINIITIVSNGVVVGEKIESKNYNFKFTDKFHSNIIKIKNPYYVLIPNENNVLNKIHKFDNLTDLVNKYKDYKDEKNNTIVIGMKTNKLVDKLFLKSLHQLKNAVACSVKTSLKGNLCLVYKIKDGVDQNSIVDTLWDDIQEKKNAMFQKFFTYTKQNIKEYQVAKMAITDI